MGRRHVSMDELEKDVPADVVPPVTWVAPKVAQRQFEAEIG